MPRMNRVPGTLQVGLLQDGSGSPLVISVPLEDRKECLVRALEFRSWLGEGNVGVFGEDDLFILLEDLPEEVA